MNHPAPHQIIEKHGHKITDKTLLFYVWLCSRYPNGVLRTQIEPNYIKMGKNMLSKHLSELREERLVKFDRLRTEYSKVTPTP